MKQLYTLALVVCLTFFISCASSEDFVQCPPLSAPTEGVRVYIQTDYEKQRAEVRLNGVSAQCTLESSGDIMMEVKAGLKLARNLNQGAGADIAIVPLIIAIVDADDNVLLNKQISYKTGFGQDTAKFFPVVEFELIVPVDGRAVISLTPTQ